MRRIRFKLCIAISGMISVLFSSSVAQAQTLSWEDVGTSLVCQCGCQSVLPACTHVECGSATAMKAEIKSMIAKGMDKNQIIQAFMLNYGEQVLAAPTKKGFNLTAWIAPFAALVVGAVVLFVVIRDWVKRSKEGYPKARVPVEIEKEDPYKRRLEEELKSWKA